MTQIQKALLLAAGMFGIAVASLFEIVPQEVAQWAPAALLVMFPSAWRGASSKCGKPA